MHLKLEQTSETSELQGKDIPVIKISDLLSILSHCSSAICTTKQPAGCHSSEGSSLNGSGRNLATREHEQAEQTREAMETPPFRGQQGSPAEGSWDCALSRSWGGRREVSTRPRCVSELPTPLSLTSLVTGS